MDTSEITTQPEPESGQRRGLMTGRAYDPVIVKKKAVEIKVELRPLDDDSTGPVARRRVPLATPVDAQPANDADLRVLERAVKSDDRAERDAVAVVKAKLRSTHLVNAQAAADAAAAWDREHGDYFRRLQRVLTSGELLRQAGDSSRDRINRLDGIVAGVLRSLNLLPGFPEQVEKAINNVTAASLVPKMTSRGEGYEADMMRSPGVTAVERLAATSSTEGVLRSLNESLESALVIVGEIAERIGQQQLTSTLERPITYAISPETQRMREALRPSPVLSRADNGGPPGNESDWNPLDYTPRRS